MNVPIGQETKIDMWVSPLLERAEAEYESAERVDEGLWAAPNMTAVLEGIDALRGWVQEVFAAEPLSDERRDVVAHPPPCIVRALGYTTPAHVWEEVGMYGFW